METGKNNVENEGNEDSGDRNKKDSEEVNAKNTADIIFKELEKATKECREREDYAKSCVEGIREDIQRVAKKTEEINTLHEDMRMIKDGMKEIGVRVDHLENMEKSVVEEVKKHLQKIEKDELDKRNLKSQILEKIGEEEKCCLIIGFPIVTEWKKDVIGCCHEGRPHC